MNRGDCRQWRRAKIVVSIILLSVFLCLFSLSGFADDRADMGYQIACEADRRASGFCDFRAEMEMILRNRPGRESHRRIRVRAMETENDGDKSLTIFDSPADVRGTALLTHSHKSGDDDQWLYLPALKRVKRISSRNKSGAFMGSEFSYEDLGSLEIEKYTYKYLGEDNLNDHQCFMLERSPKDKKNSGYSRIISWLDQDEYRVWKEEYYDKRNRLLKTLTLGKYQLYLKTVWRAHFMHMVNHQTGKETDLIWSNFFFRTGLSSKDFNKNSLKRAR